jgi:pSer/pThr/pTyr-binding forkhead associated (FHA) protein
MPELKAYLVAEERKITLNLEETTIGRSTASNIPINDPTISKQHAAINYVGR